jgi:hypothetical protein
MRTQTQFARNGDVHIAFQVVGEGDLDLLLIDTWVHHVEAVWDFPDFARFLRRLSSFGRLIHFDRRGTGLSDPVPLDQLPEVLVSSTVKDLLAGSGLTFEDRLEHELKGVPGSWRLFAAQWHVATSQA